MKDLPIAPPRPGAPAPQASRRRGLPRRVFEPLALLAAGLIVAALVLEAAVTLVFGEQPKFPRYVVGAPWGLRTNLPHARYRHASADVRVDFAINGQGMRAPHDYAYAKPPGVVRILSLGDSYTIGYEVAAESSFSSVLERALRARGERVEVLNAGVSGFGTAEECAYLEREGLRFHPDIVLVGFYFNDLVDNTRSGLFGLRDGRLVPAAARYVPGGGLADFLNEHQPFQWLSTHSNAFALVKERATGLAKESVVHENERQLGLGGAARGTGAGTAAQRADSLAASARADSLAAYQRRLGAAILERLYADTRARGIRLVVLGIPLGVPPRDSLIDQFPLGEFDVHRPGLTYVAAKPLLDPFVGKRQLYWHRSQGHWTPFSHAVVGRALADAIARDALATAPGTRGRRPR